MKYIEQREFDSDHDAYQGANTFQNLASTSSEYRTEDGAGPIVDFLKSTRTSESVLEPVLHGHSVAVDDVSQQVKQTFFKNTADAISVEHHQAFCTANIELSPSIISSSNHTSRNSILKQSFSTQSSTLSSKPNSLFVAKPATQRHIAQQQLQQESCHPVLTVPNPMKLNRASDPISGSQTSVDHDPSPTTSTVMVSPQQDFIPSSEKFLDFTPQATFCTDINPQVPSLDFNYLSNPSFHNVQNLDTGPCLDISMPTFDRSPPLLNITSGSPMQQIVSETMDGCNFNAAVSIPHCSVTTIGHSCPQADHMQTLLNSCQNAGLYHRGAHSHMTTVDQGTPVADFPFVSQTNIPNSSSSNLEVQDILQQFV